MRCGPPAAGEAQVDDLSLASSGCGLGCGGSAGSIDHPRLTAALVAVGPLLGRGG